jgi:hypothetical protein
MTRCQTSSVVIKSGVLGLPYLSFVSPFVQMHARLPPTLSTSRHRYSLGTQESHPVRGP